jgi:hypothetical protein
MLQVLGYDFGLEIHYDFSSTKSSQLKVVNFEIGHGPSLIMANLSTSFYLIALKQA